MCRWASNNIIATNKLCHMSQSQVFLLYNSHVFPDLSKFSIKTVRHDKKLLLTCFTSGTPLLVMSSLLLLRMTGTLYPLVSPQGSTCKHEISHGLHKNMGICPFIRRACNKVHLNYGECIA